MTKRIKFNGTKFADILGISATSLNQKLLGKAGDDVLLGSDGNDKLKGNNGDDWIAAGGGNDDIDGGKGFDTAVYRGRFSEYSLTFKSNLDGTVQDLTAGRDGTDTLKKVEFLKFSDGIYDIDNDTFQFFNLAPTLTAPTSIAYNDTASHDTFSAVAATLSATDPNADPLTYSLGGGVSNNSLAGYDVSQSSAHGTMYLNSASGAYTFVPASAAIEALKTSASVDFTFTASDGEFSDSKTLSVTLNGVNDTATITGLATGTVIEDNLFTAGGAVVVNDPDAGDAHFQTPASLAGNYGHFVFSAATGSWEYVLDNGAAALQHLAAGDVRHDTLTVTSADGTASRTIDITINGYNDAPVLQTAIGSEPVFADDSLTLSATIAFSDIDLTDAHIVAFTHIGHDFIGDFSADVTADSTGGVEGSIALTYHLTLQQFLDSGGQFPDHQVYRVTIDDLHGGTQSQDISIPLAEILDGAGGGGTTQPPVFTAGANPLMSGHALGQIVDSPNVLNPPTSSTNLTVQGTLYFTDADGGNHHASVDLAHALVIGHMMPDANGVLQPVPGAPVVTTSAGVWQVFVQEPGEVHWSYTLTEEAIRLMSQGELQSMIFPIVVSEDGVGQSIQNVRIDLFGMTEVPSLLPPNTLLTAATDISPYLIPPGLATHFQTQDFSITEDPLVTGSTGHHTLSGTISFVDPDRLDHPTVSMQLTDPGVPQGTDVLQLMNGFHYTVEQFGNYGMIHWTYDVQDSALDFLAHDGTLTVGARFDVRELAGGSSSAVNVTLHGSNDAVVIPGNSTDSVSVALGGGTAGNFIYIDPDQYPDGHSVDIVAHNSESHGHMFGGTGVEGPDGGVAGVPGTISWFYSADPGQVTGTLDAGQHDVFDIFVYDHYGSVTVHTIDILLV